MKMLSLQGLMPSNKNNVREFLREHLEIMWKSKHIFTAKISEENTSIVKLTEL